MTDDSLKRMMRQAYEQGIQDAAEVADRLAKPEPGLKGWKYHHDVGAVTAALVISTAIRALTLREDGR